MAMDETTPIGWKTSYVLVRLVVDGTRNGVQFVRIVMDVVISPAGQPDTPKELKVEWRAAGKPIRRQKMNTLPAAVLRLILLNRVLNRRLEVGILGAFFGRCRRGNGSIFHE